MINNLKHINGRVILLLHQVADHKLICPLRLLKCAICEEMETQLHVAGLYQHVIESTRACRQLRGENQLLKNNYNELNETFQNQSESLVTLHERLQILEYRVVTNANRNTAIRADSNCMNDSIDDRYQNTTILIIIILIVKNCLLILHRSS